MSPPSTLVPAAFGPATPLRTPDHMRWTAEDLAVLGELLVDDAVALNTASESSQPAMMTKEERLRRKCRRKYQRRLTRMQDLRDEVDALERRLKQLELQPRQQWTVSEVEEEQEPELDLQVKLQRLAARRVQLQQENAQLRSAFREAVRGARVIRELFTSTERRVVARAGELAYVQPLTAAECLAMRNQALRAYSAFNANPRLSTSATSTTCGWSGRRVAGRRSVRYSLHKTHYNASCDALAEFSWRLLSEASMLQSLYSPTLATRCRLVQRVDDDNAVLLREFIGANHEGDGPPEYVMSLYLVSRGATRRGHVQVVCGLPSERLEFIDTPSSKHTVRHIGSDIFSWSEQERVGDKQQHVVTSMAGLVPLVGNDARFWMTETLMGLVEAEKVLSGTRFTLQT